jgi:hypothetical protein
MLSKHLTAMPLETAFGMQPNPAFAAMHYETATASLFFGHHRSVTPMTPQDFPPEDDAIPILTLQQANDHAKDLWPSHTDDISPTKDETATANLPYVYGNSESWELYPEDSTYAELLENLISQCPTQPTPRPSTPQCTSAQPAPTAQSVPISPPETIASAKRARKQTKKRLVKEMRKSLVYFEDKFTEAKKSLEAYQTHYQH